jgi:hypothetical protein
MMQLWRLFQGGGMGVGYLPDAGGALDQPVLMMRAFSLMSDFEHRLTKGVDGTPAIPLDEHDQVDYRELNRRHCAAFGISL